MRNVSDEELVRRSLKDSEVYNLLVERHRQGLLRFILHRFGKEKEWAEDIVQESLIRAYSHLSKFNFENKWRTWLFSIAINVANNELVKPRDMPLDDHYPAVSRGDSGLEASLRLLKVSRAYLKLDERHQVVLRLHLVEQLSAEEISYQLKNPVFVVKNRIRFALKELVKSYYIDS